MRIHVKARNTKSGTGVPGSPNEFVYDERGHLIGEYGSTGTIIEETVYQVWIWNPLDFGSNVPHQNPSGLGTFPYNLRFPGQYYDSETALSYNMLRDYNPVLGRYIQSDPIGLSGGINTYAYVGSNPVTMVDPSGLCGSDPQVQNFLCKDSPAARVFTSMKVSAAWGATKGFYVGFGGGEIVDPFGGGIPGGLAVGLFGGIVGGTGGALTGSILAWLCSLEGAY